MKDALSLNLVADGNPLLQSTNSGVARGLYLGMSERSDVTIAGTFDSTLDGASQRAAVALSMLRAKRDYRSEFRFGRTGIVARSKRRDQFARDSVADFTVHVRNVYEPATVPYAAFIDSTTALAQANWPEWLRRIGDPQARIAAEVRYLQRAAVVFSASRTTADSVVADYGVSPSRVEVVGGGVRFRPLPPVVERHPRVGVLKVLFVGTEFSRKGGDVLVHAIALCRSAGYDVSLDLVGIKPWPELPPWCTAHGRVDDSAELSKRYRAADVFALPARHEPYGLVIPEAMAFGLPCLGTRVGAMSEIISDGTTGYLVDSEDASTLAERISMLADSPVLRVSMGRAGRQVVHERLSWDVVAGKIAHRLRKDLG